jgi:hypothetical protein
LNFSELLLSIDGRKVSLSEPLSIVTRTDCWVELLPIRRERFSRWLLYRISGRSI